jgi:Tol biopolymer transport system component
MLYAPFGDVSANGKTEQPSISSDGAWIAFASERTDLVANVLTIGHVYRVPRATPSQIQAVTHPIPSGNGAPLGQRSNPAIIPGRFLVFDTNLVGYSTGDTRAGVDVTMWSP